jgi:hypothetical protein
MHHHLALLSILILLQLLCQLVLPLFEGLRNLRGLDLILQYIVESLERLNWQGHSILHIQTILNGPASRDWECISIYKGTVWTESPVSQRKIIITICQLVLELFYSEWCICYPSRSYLGLLEKKFSSS